MFLCAFNPIVDQNRNRECVAAADYHNTYTCMTYVYLHIDLCAAVQLVSGVVNSINEDIKRQEKRFKVCIYTYRLTDIHMYGWREGVLCVWVL